MKRPLPALAVALLGVLACHPPSRHAGVANFGGTIRLELVNPGTESICDVRMFEEHHDAVDLLVCRPEGTQVSYAMGSTEKCFGTCLQPGETRSFSVRQGQFRLGGQYEKTATTFATSTYSLRGPTRFVFGGPSTVPARSPEGLAVVRMAPDKERQPAHLPPTAGPPPGGHCVPNGVVPEPGEFCCSNIMCQVMDGHSRPVCRPDACPP